MLRLVYKKIWDDTNEKIMGKSAIEKYKTIMDTHIEVNNHLAGIVFEETDSLRELYNFLELATGNWLVKIILIDTHSLNKELIAQVEGYVAGYMAHKKVDEWGYKWRNLETYENVIAYGLIHISVE